MANLRPELARGVKRFQKKTENFICFYCSFSVKGTGYTNHCPKCLWSRHVDVNPGDRASKCGGMMEPAGIELKHGKRVILHRCKLCGFERRNKIEKNDNLETILNIFSPLAR